MSLLDNARLRGLAYQGIAIACAVAIFWFLYRTASVNLVNQNIATGFGFLRQPAGFDISDSLIAFSPTDTFGRALLVGLLNTIKVSALAIIAGTFVGLLVGIGRLSANPLLSRMMLVYVEALRNVPLLLYLFLWYAIIIFSLPPVRQAIHVLPGVYLSNSGLVVPAVGLNRPAADAVTLLLCALLPASLWWRIGRRREVHGVRSGPSPWWAAVVFVLILAAGWVLLGFSVQFDPPALGRFRLSGGHQLRPEFVALLTGLSLNLSASVAEIVRAGIQSVDKGQWEAARALGLRPSATTRMVVLPQALRIAVPPLTSNYLTTVKNSSLAIAIGFPDIVSVSNTMMNKTGQAIETIAIFMAVYLAISILISLAMNWYNARIALKGA